MGEWWSAKGNRIPLTTFWRDPFPPSLIAHSGNIARWWAKDWYRWWLRAAQGREEVASLAPQWWGSSFAPVSAQEIAAVRIQRWWRIFCMECKDKKAAGVLKLEALQEAVHQAARKHHHSKPEDLAREDSAGLYFLAQDARGTPGLYRQQLGGWPTCEPPLGPLDWQHKQLASCLRQIYFAKPIPPTRSTPYTRWGAPRWMGRYGGGGVRQSWPVGPCRPERMPDSPCLGRKQHSKAFPTTRP